MSDSIGSNPLYCRFQFKERVLSAISLQYTDSDFKDGALLRAATYFPTAVHTFQPFAGVDERDALIFQFSDIFTESLSPERCVQAWRAVGTLASCAWVEDERLQLRVAQRFLNRPVQGPPLTRAFFADIASAVAPRGAVVTDPAVWSAMERIGKVLVEQFSRPTPESFCFLED